MKTSSTSRKGVTKVLRILTLLTAVSLLIGLLVVVPEATPAPGKKADEEAKLRHAWHLEMVKIPHPKKTGTFEAHYPKKEWKEVKYTIKPVLHPALPRRSGPRPLIVGNGNNLSAQAPTGFISSATGSFDSVTGVTSESGQVNATGPAVANAYMLQLNTNFFASTFAGSPAGCQGWEQFIFQNDGGSSTNNAAYIQYWLINYGATSPGPGWTQYGSDWWKNSTMHSMVPNQPISNLANLRLSGTASATGDTYFFSTGTTIYSAKGDNTVKAAAGWNTAEFCVVGDGGGGQANFNSGSTVVTRTEITDGGTAPPICVAEGFTAETNNLGFGPTAPLPSQPGPAIEVTESSAGGATANCAVATTVGDTHLTTFGGLMYDFQASGDFVLAQVDPDFVVHTRQVSGAPKWPDAAVNSAVATRMGKTTVAISVGSKRLVIDGKSRELGDGRSHSTADGVDVWRRGNVYFITSRGGHSVRATVHVTSKMSWIDVMVGLCHCCAKTKAKGLLANISGNVHQIAARDGTVLTNPFSFKDLYTHHGNSWRVPPTESLLSVFGKMEGANPQKPFYAIHLDPKVSEHLRAVCKKAGVKEGAHLDAATLDLAVIGDEEAAHGFVGVHPPIAVGKHVTAVARK